MADGALRDLMNRLADKNIRCSLCQERCNTDEPESAASTKFVQVNCEGCQDNSSCVSAGIDIHAAVVRTDPVDANRSSIEAGMSCRKHPGRCVDLYCLECKLVVCAVCVVQFHDTHDSVDITDMADEFRRHITDDVTTVRETIRKCEEMLTLLSSGKDELRDNVKQVKNEIHERGEQLKRLIEEEKHKPLDELASSATNRLKQVDTVMHDIDQRVILAESFITDTEELIASGAAGDLERHMSILHNRANELAELKTLQNALNYLGSVRIAFGETRQHLFGKIVIARKNAAAARIARIIPAVGGRAVRGVTSLNDKLYVARDFQRSIAVYDTATFALERHVAVKGLGDDVRGLTSCAINNCLYVSDWGNMVVHRVEPSEEPFWTFFRNRKTDWSLDVVPHGLSVNGVGNVIVSGWRYSKIGWPTIIEYTTRGSLVREISLQSDVIHPWHAVQLASGQFAVSHGEYGDSQHRLCLVDHRGRVVASHGDTPGSANGQLNIPGQLAVDRNGFMFVAVVGSNRVAVLDPSLGLARELTLHEGDKLQGPFALYLDEPRDRLYVGEDDGGRVLVIDNVLTND